MLEHEDYHFVERLCFVPANLPTGLVQDRLMQDILDRGLGSEDRKTLRKLASVGAPAGIGPTRGLVWDCHPAATGARDAEAEAAQAGCQVFSQERVACRRPRGLHKTACSGRLQTLSRGRC